MSADPQKRRANDRRKVTLFWIGALVLAVVVGLGVYAEYSSRQYTHEQVIRLEGRRGLDALQLTADNAMEGRPLDTGGVTAFDATVAATYKTYQDDDDKLWPAIDALYRSQQSWSIRNPDLAGLIAAAGVVLVACLFFIVWMLAELAFRR